MSSQTILKVLNDRDTNYRSHKSSIKKLEFQKFLVLICAYNEEKNLRCLLEILKGKDILVIDDGSVDKTREIAENYGARILTHDSRLGKSSALADGISYAVQNSYRAVLEIDADAIPTPGAMSKILKRIEDPEIGAVSCKQIPIGRPSLAYFIDELIWSILAQAKAIQMADRGTCHLGAVIVAFKPDLVDSIKGSINDDEQLGVSIESKGYKIVFQEDAIVYFDASSCLGHLLERRRRMYYGHMVFAQSNAPSMEFSTSCLALVKAVIERPKRILCVFPTLALDLYARMMAWRDFRNPLNSKYYTRWVTTFAKDDSLAIHNRSDY